MRQKRLTTRLASFVTDHGHAEFEHSLCARRVELAGRRDLALQHRSAECELQMLGAHRIEPLGSHGRLVRAASSVDSEPVRTSQVPGKAPRQETLLRLDSNLTYKVRVFGHWIDNRQPTVQPYASFVPGIAGGVISPTMTNDFNTGYSIRRDPAPRFGLSGRLRFDLGTSDQRLSVHVLTSPSLAGRMAG